LTNLAAVAATTGDADPAETTDKFQALYSPLFKIEMMTNPPDESPTALREGNGKQTFDLLAKQTKDPDTPDLLNPLMVTTPTSFEQVTSHDAGKADKVDNNLAYQFIFAPGLMVDAAA
jgi:hypothetical protein